MKHLLFISCLLINIFLSSCSFQMRFFQEMNLENINKNLDVSPLSAYQVLGLTANGAKGTTLTQMLECLGNESLDELNNINQQILSIFQSFTSIEIANAVMTKLRPKQTFLNAAEMYEATVEPLQSLAQVNNWCNLKTHGTIPTILDELPGDTIMVLLNAIYFKGTWKTEFDVRNTTIKTFYNFGKTEKKVNTMKTRDKFNYYYDRSVQVIELPYTKDSMSAVIILPFEGKDINEYIRDLDDDKIHSYIKRMTEEVVDLELPKFTVEFSAELNKVLQKMGMVLAFKGTADFTNMIDGSARVNKVVQKTYLSVDEHGTEASGASAVIMTKGMIPRMTINRPFIFMLRNKDLPYNYEMMFMAKIEEL